MPARHRWKFLLAILCTAQIVLPAFRHPPAQLPALPCSTLNRMNPVTSLATVPKDIAALDGKRIIVTGFVLEPTDMHGRWFMLFDINPLREHGPRPEDRVYVTLVPAATLPSDESLWTDEVDVSGTFHVHIDRDDDGRIMSVFHLDADRMVSSDVTPPPIPIWVRASRVTGIAGLIAILIVPLGQMIRRKIISCRKPKPGFCPRCGYDLRATPVRCPECGWSCLEKLSDCPDRMGS